MINETASFASPDLSQASPATVESWREMKAVEMLAEQMNIGFAEAFGRYHEMKSLGQPVPIAPAVSFQERSPSRVTITMPGLGDVDVANLSEQQRSDAQEISGIARQESVSLEEAAARHIARHPERY